jgi:hypothetical protein
MTVLLPSEESAAGRTVASVLETVATGGIELPPLVVVDDRAGEWRRLVVSRPDDERRRSVVAVSSTASLVDAVRLGFGGALWLPPSTPSLEAACEAAAASGEGNLAPTVPNEVLEMVSSRATELRVVTWMPRAFWDRQVGATALVVWLKAVAEELEVVPAVAPWPALVVADRSETEIVAACRAAVDDRGALAGVEPTIVDVSEAAGSPDPRATLEAELAATDAEAQDATGGTGMAKPVHELPHGGRVGWWAPHPPASTPETGWLATPSAPTQLGYRWEMNVGSNETGFVADATTIEPDADRSPPALRVPGWIASGVRRGSPAGLLVEGMARHPARAGRPLWVPNVGVDSVRFLLSLPGPIWVDGPGVPK